MTNSTNLKETTGISLLCPSNSISNSICKVNVNGKNICKIKLLKNGQRTNAIWITTTQQLNSSRFERKFTQTYVQAAYELQKNCRLKQMWKLTAVFFDLCHFPIMFQFVCILHPKNKSYSRLWQTGCKQLQDKKNKWLLEKLQASGFCLNFLENVL